MRKFILKRDVDTVEYPWLEFTLEKGTTLHEFPDIYGCGDDGITVSLEFGKYPYFELPEDALEEVIGPNFSEN